ncbi:hypothetical protein [uncultured Campylobacter sp.]|uniref:hypothetical protein n=1 Tax=uncultured Campylobacter sp. TaxID=218934 RepID=UPI0026383717|nr:hypothetical protein [uncultured Campylobacter sp.]
MKLRLRGVVAWGFFASCARAMWQCDQGRSENSDICGAGGYKILRRKCPLNFKILLPLCRIVLTRRIPRKILHRQNSTAKFGDNEIPPPYFAFSLL